MKIFIKNATIVNDGKIYRKDIVIDNDKILEINANITIPFNSNYLTIDVDGSYVLPGIIDDQVHFREPGLTKKADIYTESRAAVAGGITSYMEMPNTIPQTVSQQLLEKKYAIASQKSLANYSFYIGATNTNIDELLKTNPQNVCGIKIFMGSSTGNMLVDSPIQLERIFSQSPMLIAVHCEDEAMINHNLKLVQQQYGENIPIHLHPKIRSGEACYKSSRYAVSIAKKHNTRLHVLHVSTAKELELFDNRSPLEEKLITAEACIHHLWFEDNDYKKYGTMIKWNPAIKTEYDREGLINGVICDKIDVIATDHAPHTIDEKMNTYLKAPSGGPMVQHSLIAMLELFHRRQISLEKIVKKMCHNPAEIFKIKNRGYIKPGFFADLVIVDIHRKQVVTKDSLFYKCKWSPLENQTFNSTVTHTIINGHLAYCNGRFDESNKGRRLEFNR